MAVLLVGDEEEVRKAMAASQEDFAAYRLSGKEPPWQQFDRLIELIITRQRDQIEETRRRLADVKGGRRPPKDSS